MACTRTDAADGDIIVRKAWTARHPPCAEGEVVLVDVTAAPSLWPCSQHGGCVSGNSRAKNAEEAPREIRAGCR